jgi:hypothetical protein
MKGKTRRISRRGGGDEIAKLIDSTACRDLLYFRAVARRCASDAASVEGFSLCTWS